MYDENPGEIDFGSSQREVRVSEGSSYRESTVVTVPQVFARVSFLPVSKVGNAHVICDMTVRMCKVLTLT